MSPSYWYIDTKHMQKTLTWMYPDSIQTFKNINKEKYRNSAKQQAQALDNDFVTSSNEESTQECCYYRMTISLLIFLRVNNANPLFLQQWVTQFTKWSLQRTAVENCKFLDRDPKQNVLI